MQCPTLPVLLYHQVGANCVENNSTQSLFLSHMQYLAEKGFQTLSGEEFACVAFGSKAIPDKAVLITFDDGFASDYVNAFPILKTLGMHAVTFLITGKVKVGEVRRGKAEIADVTGEHLRWSEVEEMVASGVFEAHSHSHSHVRWHKIYSDTAEHLRVLEEDLAASYQMLKARFGSDGPRHLAWPWGFSMPDTRAVAQSMGFGFQYTVKNNFNTRATPLNQINRLCMDGKSLGEFAARLEFFRNPLLRQLYPPVLHQFDWMKRLVKGR